MLETKIKKEARSAQELLVTWRRDHVRPDLVYSSSLLLNISPKDPNYFICCLHITYSESQIYEYIARVFYNVVFSTYLGSNAAEKRV